MFRTDTEGNRGQVGIGTLIVFIALVLVAAIAAGVLINTAGFLQSQAEATGEESTDQVSNTLDVTSAVATSGGDTVTFGVKKGAGSDPIELENVEIQLVGSDSDVLGEGSDLSGDTAVSSIDAVVAENDGNSALEEPGDRYEIEVDMTSTTLGSLSAADQVDVTFTTADGSQTFEVLRVGDPADFPEEL